MKTIFKEGDKVFDVRYGWGEVIYIIDNGLYRVKVMYEYGTNTYTSDGFHLKTDLIPILSFTEYTLQGFSQERPEILPERGQIVWVRSNENSDWYCAQFMSKDDTGYKVTNKNPFDDINGLHYNLLTTINPYSNK